MVFCAIAGPRAPEPQPLAAMHRTHMPQRGRSGVRIAPLAVALATALVLCAGAAQAQSLALSNLVVDNQAGTLMARFGVAVEGAASLTDQLQAGATLALSCKARLSKSGGLLGGARVSDSEMVSRLKFDPLSREYVLQAPGREAPLRAAALDELLRSGWGELALDLGSWRQLESGQDYSVTLEIKLSQAEIPGWLRRNLFFWSWDVIPATSYQLHFRY